MQDENSANCTVNAGCYRRTGELASFPGHDEIFLSLAAWIRRRRPGIFSHVSNVMKKGYNCAWEHMQGPEQ